jgi:hypothetical protein
MSELSRREAIILTAAATLVASTETHAADEADAQLTFDVLSSPPDPLSIPINIVSVKNRTAQVKPIVVRAEALAPGSQPQPILKAEFFKNAKAVNLSVRLKCVLPDQTKTDFKISVKEDEFKVAETTENSQKSTTKKVSVGKASCLPPASATMRLSTQPAIVAKDGLVIVKCVAPQPIVDANSKALWRINTVAVEFFPADPAKVPPAAPGAPPADYRLLLITGFKSTVGGATFSISDDGLLQADLNLGSAPAAGIGWLKVTWSIRPADQADASKDQTISATNIVYFKATS